MGNWFSGADSAAGAGNAITEHDRAILDLKAQRDRLEIYVKKLEVVRAKEEAAAKRLIKEGKRSQAQLCLKKRKFQEILINKSEQMYLNLAQLVESVEFAKVQASVFDQLKKGANVLKAMQAEMSVDAVEELMADTQEALDYQKEVDALISQNLSPDDEQDVLDELESLSSEITEADLKPRQPAKVVAAAAGSKQPARVESTATSPIAEPAALEAPASPVDESAISADDLKELEELEDIMQVPSAPTHSVKVPASQQPAATSKGKQRQLVSE
eukprot:TRINITY_DN13311_c0_g1_i1.p1 TRINITY_DN13311_c0_g1~~TRINITY_DN13311_c0_g1_i1.p1  ORF type:complete len:272 (+),score=86.44 TRINITY_DN13311_c0_g1_i1:13-828(+)